MLAPQLLNVLLKIRLGRKRYKMGLRIKGPCSNTISVNKMKIGDIGRIINNDVLTIPIGTLVIMIYGHTLVNLENPIMTWNNTSIRDFQSVTVEIFPSKTELILEVS